MPVISVLSDRRPTVFCPTTCVWLPHTLGHLCRQPSSSLKKHIQQVILHDYYVSINQQTTFVDSRITTVHQATCYLSSYPMLCYAILCYVMCTTVAEDEVVWTPGVTGCPLSCTVSDYDLCTQAANGCFYSAYVQHQTSNSSNIWLRLNGGIYSQ